MNTEHSFWVAQCAAAQNASAAAFPSVAAAIQPFSWLVYQEVSNELGELVRVKSKNTGRISEMVLATVNDVEMRSALSYAQNGKRKG